MHAGDPVGYEAFAAALLANPISELAIYVDRVLRAHLDQIKKEQ